MSDGGHRVRNPQNITGKILGSFEIWNMKMKAWLLNITFGAVLANGFDETLPSAEATALGLTYTGKKAQSESRDLSTKGINDLILVYTTQAIMNKTFKNQKKDPDWQTYRSGSTKTRNMVM